jgi:hypothetical protein
VKAAPQSRGRCAQRSEKGGVVDQEDLREGRTALEADLLAGVEALRLADAPQRPPQARAVCELDLERAGRQAHRSLPAHGSPAVQVVARESAGHADL